MPFSDFKRANKDLIKSRFYKGKMILLTGPRQTGKTHLLRQIASELKADYLWLNGDEADVRALLTNTTTTALRSLLGKNKVILLDEAQRIVNVGLTLKLLVDNFPDVQVVATGSSALDLNSEVNEPLTGRKYEFNHYPFAYSELISNTNVLEERRLLEQRLVFGSYPEVVLNPGEEQERLQLLVDSYLYKDLLQLDQIHKPVLLQKLVQALALQVGSEVSYNELSGLVGADVHTVEKYVDLLEKAFVIFRMNSLSRNARNELKKGKKIYFVDNGVRNALIKQFQPLSFRNDVGALWENYLVSERRKRNACLLYKPLVYFWRTTTQQEIDYIEEFNGQFKAWEFKWNEKAKQKVPKSFLEAYPGTEVCFMTRSNYWEMLDATEV